MSNSGAHRGVRTFALPWRKACAVLPAVALIGGGIAMAAPASDVKSTPVANTLPAVVVPRAALTMPAVPAGAGTRAPALVLPEGAAPGSSALVLLDDMGIPIRALKAYRQGASLVEAADAACHIDWALLAAIGRVESNHAQFDGNQLDSAGVAQPGIIGIRLDGTNGTARITDTDAGRLDRDTSYDRAVGPMQFIPSTWRAIGSDGNGDNVKDPQNMADAATAAAVYLCSGPGDLSRAGDLHAAILRYNPSEAYARTVTAIANAYRHGVSALPASDLPAANQAPARAGAAGTTTKTARPSMNRPAPRPSPPAREGSPVTTRAPATAPPPSQRSPVSAVPLPALPISPQSPTPSGLPSLPPSGQNCTVSSFGLKTCAIAPFR
jgi:Transglycosylase SLT domain